MPKEFNPTFTLDQAKQLIKVLPSIKEVGNIAFGSTSNIESVLLKCGTIPFMLLGSKHKSLRQGTKEQYKLGSTFEHVDIYLNKAGEYIFTPYDDYFTNPSKPLYLAIDNTTQEFMFQYEFGICIFGDITGSLYFINME